MLALTPALQAQSWRTLDASHAREGEDTLRVRAVFASGDLEMTSGDPATLYNLHLRWDANQITPVHRYDAANHALILGLGNTGGGTPADQVNSRMFAVGGKGHPSSLSLALARGIPIDLQLSSGASLTRLDLGDLTVSRLRLETGASETHIDFRTPNGGPMQELDLNSGAAVLEVRHLGNADAAVARVHTGIGAVDLDFGGAWKRDMTLHLDVALGAVTLSVPRDVGLQVRVSKVLANFEGPEMTEKDGVFTSANFASASRELTIESNANFGNVEVRWLDR